MLLGTLLGLALVVTPVSAQAADQTTRTGRQLTAVDAASPRPSASSAVSAGAEVRPAAYTHLASAAQAHPQKTKKKRGFFKKLGIFLLVVLIVIILIVVLAIWLLIRAARRLFRRRRS
ncbi:hypothetical protein [Streptomyces sp. CBMA152]|uniref:hypothetical protein n=1 Tax=Streptomyces sp. CBMA152 TaxID=1896312 RepID=UPI0016615F64|nr:hypothetical protein [Streptomyces sp. CBMA152]